MSLSKIQDFDNLTIKEIENKISKLKIEILNFKIQKATRQNIKPHVFKHTKHTIAQLLTLKTQKVKLKV